MSCTLNIYKTGKAIIISVTLMLIYLFIML